MAQTRLIAFSASFLLAGLALAQQTKTGQGTAGRTSTTAVENEEIRVTKVTQAPHQKTRPHQHPMNRVMLYLTAGRQDETYEDGSVKINAFRAGEPKWSAAGGIHVAEIVSNDPVTIVEMELWKPATGKMTPVPGIDPLKADPKHYSLEFENDQVRVLRVKLGPHETTAVHDHILHRVVTYLTDENIRVINDDGSAEARMHKAGDIVWGQRAKHKEENLSDQMMEAVIVELR